LRCLGHRIWNVTDGGRERRYYMFRDGEILEFHVNDPDIRSMTYGESGQVIDIDAMVEHR